MKNTITDKKGISLIVLILTIIVMIILATAIILSISNSGIMSKANKAKKDSDTANLTEYVNVLKAEWELMTETERGDKSSMEYINEKLAEKYSNVAYSADGQLYSGLEEVAYNAITNGIKIGDKVAYTVETRAEVWPVEWNFELFTSKDLDCVSSNKINYGTDAEKDIEWIFIGIDDNGKLLITAESTEGTDNYTFWTSNNSLEDFTTSLDKMCDVFYTTECGKARNMNIDDIIRLIGYTGPTCGYINSDGKFTPLTSSKTIGDLAEELNVSLGPDEHVSNYRGLLSNYFEIDYVNDQDLMKFPENVDLIPSGIVASSCSYVTLSRRYEDYFGGDFDGSIGFGIFCSGSRLVPYTMCYNFANESPSVGPLIPVISISSKLTKTTNNGNTIWSFE